MKCYTLHVSGRDGKAPDNGLTYYIKFLKNNYTVNYSPNSAIFKIIIKYIHVDYKLTDSIRRGSHSVISSIPTRI